jgi:hypothetical protein
MTARAPSEQPHPAEGHGHRHSHRLLYLVLASAFIALAAVAVVAYQQNRADQQGRAKAEELQARFAAAGLPLPLDVADIARMFRGDGGAVCANPDSALRRAQWQQDMSNGAAGPGQRPIIADRDIARADMLIIDTYCPLELPDFKSKVDKLKLDDTVE